MQPYCKMLKFISMSRVFRYEKGKLDRANELEGFLANKWTLFAGSVVYGQLIQVTSSSVGLVSSETKEQLE